MQQHFLPEQISGNRITLHKHTVNMAGKMFKYIQEDRERLSEYLPWPKYIITVEDEIDFIRKCSRAWDNQESAHYGIYRNSDGEYLGNISPFGFNWDVMYCEIGYWILGRFEGAGYMSDSVSLLQKALYEIGLNRIVIRCDPRNERSSSIPKRLDYLLEGTLREIIMVNGDYRDLDIYSKLKSDR